MSVETDVWHYYGKAINSSKHVACMVVTLCVEYTLKLVLRAWLRLGSVRLYYKLLFLSLFILVIIHNFLYYVIREIRLVMPVAVEYIKWHFSFLECNVELRIIKCLHRKFNERLDKILKAVKMQIEFIR